MKANADQLKLLKGMSHDQICDAWGSGRTGSESSYCHEKHRHAIREYKLNRARLLRRLRTLLTKTEEFQKAAREAGIEALIPDSLEATRLDIICILKEQ